MSLSRSASVPGGLSINTGAANLFPSQPPASGSLFGTTTQTAAKPASLFGAPAATTAATTTATTTPSLFGGAAAAKPATPSLFGGAGTTTATPGASTMAQPTATGGLFGGAPATSVGTPQSSFPGGSLFGKPATTVPAGGSLFGNPAIPQQSLGQVQQTQQTQQSQQTQQATQGQVVPGVRIDLTHLKGTTRFNDLHENLQKVVVEADATIQTIIGQKNEVDAFLPAHAESLDAIPSDVRLVERKYDGVSGALATDLQAIQTLRETVKQDAEHAQLSFKALDNQKLPAQFHTSGLWASTAVAGGERRTKRDDGSSDTAGADIESERTDLISYFSQTGDDIGQQLRKLAKNLGEIEVHMYSVQAGLVEQLQRISAASGGTGAASALAGTPVARAGTEGGEGGSNAKVAELAGVLRDFEESILAVASVVGSARESMTGLQLGGFLGRGR